MSRQGTRPAHGATGGGTRVSGLIQLRAICLRLTPSCSWEDERLSSSPCVSMTCSVEPCKTQFQNPFETESLRINLLSIALLTREVSDAGIGVHHAYEMGPFPNAALLGLHLDDYLVLEGQPLLFLHLARTARQGEAFQQTGPSRVPLFHSNFDFLSLAPGMAPGPSVL